MPLSLQTTVSADDLGAVAQPLPCLAAPSKQPFLLSDFTLERGTRWSLCIEH